MPEPLTISLEPIRADGWLERIGESIPSFQVLCEILGTRFFAFSIITGARITSLLVDRRNPDETLVEFVTGGADGDADPDDVQKLTLSEFRLRLVNALLTEERIGPAPERATDVEALQLHIGVRCLLLAPLYGYALRELTLEDSRSLVRLSQDGEEGVYPLPELRERIVAHVREELERVSRPSRGAIDLARVADADEAAELGDHARVIELLGTWPAPLAIFLRTPEGQMLPTEARVSLSRAMGLLGSACIALGEHTKGEEVLRLAVQYAVDGPAAADAYLRLGEAIFQDARLAEAIGPLRRAAGLGAPAERTWPLLARAFASRSRFGAAYGALLEGQAAGLPSEVFDGVAEQVRAGLGAAFDSWQDFVKKSEA